MTSSESELTRRLRSAWANRVDSEAAANRLDVVALVAEVLRGVGLDAGDSGGRILVEGADPVLPSALALGTGASAALVAKSVAAAIVHRRRGGPGQDVAVDLGATPRRLSPVGERRWELIGGYPATTSYPTGAPATFYRTRDGRWVLPNFYYPSLQRLGVDFFGVPNTRRHVAEAIAAWDAVELESAASEAGIPMTTVRTLPEMMRERQYREGLSELPLIEVTRIADAPAEPLPPVGAEPFAGLRALGMGHVIAGAGLGRSLALHGADVLNLWRPGECEHEHVYATSHVGMRSSLLDPRADRARVVELLGGADIFFQNRRPAFLRETGLTPQEVAAVRPGIVYATCSLHGLRGPWAEWVGFDVNAGAAAGAMMLEGQDGVPASPPIGVVNDYLVSWLLQVGVVAALLRRADEGGTYHVHVSLTRTALWLLSLGIFDKAWAGEVAGTPGHEYAEPDLFVADTPLGAYQGVTDQVRMSLTPGAYDPVLVARGSSRPVWIAPSRRP